MIRLIFRKQNYLLFLAAVINMSIVFAPIGYAANYARSTYAWLHGSWITIEKANLGGGAANYTSISVTGDALLFLFAALTTLLAAGLAIFIFINRRPILKQRALFIILIALLGQAVLGWILENHLISFVGTGGPDDLETRLQAQYWLHIFPPLFTWWAWIAVRRREKKEGAGTEKPVSS
jgi:hypothetical protein